MHKWNVSLAAVVLGLSATLLPTAPAVAAPTTPAPAAGPTQECGDDLKQHAADLAAAGKSGTATCTRKQVKQISLDGGGASIAADICGGSSTRSRIGACIVEDGILLIFLVPSGQIIGTISYTVSGLTTLNHNSLGWTQSFHYQAHTVSGPAIPAVQGTQIYGEPQCLISCTVSSSGLIGGSALPGRVHSATSNYSSPLSGYIWSAQAGFKYWFANQAWVNPVSNTSVTTPGAHRCDDALPGRPSGCVYPSIRPVLDVPSSRYPTYARHIGYAIGYGVTSVLTRTQNPTIIENNRNAACPNLPDYPRPDGFSCDEYPFASTYNGASAQPYGRTIFIYTPVPFYLFWCGMMWVPARQTGETGGYSICMIPLAENLLGGSDLSVFYYNSRVLDGDQFKVNVIW